MPLIGNEVKTINQRQKTEELFSIAAPRWIAVLGAVCLLLFGSCTVVTVVLQEDVLVWTIFGAFSLLALYLLLYGCLNRFWLEEDGVAARNWLGQVRRYPYGELKGYTQGKTELLLRLKKGKTLRVDLMTPCPQLLPLLQRYYGAVQGRALPAKPYRLLRNQVDHPGGFLFAAVLTTVLLGGLLAVLLVSYASPKERNDYLPYNVTLQALEWDKGEDAWYLNTREYPARFTVWNASAMPQGYHQIAALPEDSRVVLYCEAESSALQEEEPISVEWIEDLSGNAILSFEEVQKAGQQNLRLGLGLVGGLLVLNLLFWAGSLYVIAHADRFPRLVRLVVQPEYLRKNGR